MTIQHGVLRRCCALLILLGLPFAAPAAPREPWPGRLPSDDPAKLVAAFIQADAQGMQTSSEYWPLVQAFAVWQDGPGWDTFTIVEAAEITAIRQKANTAEIRVRYRTLGTMHTDGEGRPILDRGERRSDDAVFRLRRVSERQWKIVEPQNPPHVSVDYALRTMFDHCGNECSANPAYRLLTQRQKACVASPIPVNPACGRAK